MNRRFRTVAWMAVTALFALTIGPGCARSKQYKQEQNYYRADSEFTNRGSSIDKAEKFGQPKKKLFVLPFMNDTPFSDDQLGAVAAGELLRSLKITGRAVVPDDLRSADTSRDFFSGDKVRLSPLIREGKKLGVTLLIIGKIKRVRYRQKGDEVGLFRQKRSIAAVDVEMRLFDCAEGKEVMATSKSADSSSSQVNLFGRDESASDPQSQRMELVSEAIRNAMRLLAADIARALEKIGWEGRIAKISGGRVYVNSGRASGLNIGDILKVMTAGEDIYDPLTGAYMGRSQGQPKGTLEVIDFLGIDGAVASIHSGGGFFEGDVVQLY
ncbi:MAG: hypothetical protein HYW49_06920 [Deltaproteobacteria bacterium]|nr:hypothetical protein [Deltaproteobacteria bacterium]